MLQKKENSIAVSKLRVILLLGADFNSLNKIMFNTRVLLRIEINRIILYKVIEGCGS